MQHPSTGWRAMSLVGVAIRIGDTLPVGINDLEARVYGFNDPWCWEESHSNVALSSKMKFSCTKNILRPAPNSSEARQPPRLILESLRLARAFPSGSCQKA